VRIAFGRRWWSLRCRVVGKWSCGQRLAKYWRCFASFCLPRDFERMPQLIIFRSFDMEIVQAGLDRVYAYRRLRRWFERCKEDICCLSAAVATSSIVSSCSPLLPGTRTMYKTRRSCTSCVGFLGYFGGFARRWLKEDIDCASIGRFMDIYWSCERVALPLVDRLHIRVEEMRVECRST
jgi:hypothetical protein